MKHQTIAIVAHSNMDWVSKADFKSYSFIIGVDRGAFVLLQKGIIPTIAIGDFDSVTKAELKQIRTKVKKVEQYPKEKDQTDLELAVAYAFTLHPEEITLFGTTGGRLDQSIAALHLLRTIHEQKYVAMMKDEHNLLMLVSGKCQVSKQTHIPYISVLPLTDEIVVSIKGCKYPLHKYRMKKGTTRGVSNEIVSEYAEIHVHEGSAYCICSRDT